MNPPAPTDQLSFMGFVFTFVADRSCVKVTREADGHRLDQVAVTETPDDLHNFAHEWVAHAAGATPPEPTRCAQCSKTLTSVFGDDTSYQFDDALCISVSGGYGMFFDPIATNGAATSAFLCGSCATRLVEQLPWLAAMCDT